MKQGVTQPQSLDFDPAQLQSLSSRETFDQKPNADRLPKPSSPDGDRDGKYFPKLSRIEDLSHGYEAIAILDDTNVSDLTNALEVTNCAVTTRHFKDDFIDSDLYVREVASSGSIFNSTLWLSSQSCLGIKLKVESLTSLP
jgi:hypothetical protein